MVAHEGLVGPRTIVVSGMLGALALCCAGEACGGAGGSPGAVVPPVDAGPTEPEAETVVPPPENGTEAPADDTLVLEDESEGCEEGGEDEGYAEESSGGEAYVYDEAAVDAAEDWYDVYRAIPDTPMPEDVPVTLEELTAALAALVPAAGTPEPSDPDGLPLRQAVRGPHRAHVELVRRLEPEDEGQPTVIAYTWNEMEEWLARQHETPDGAVWDERIDEQRRKCEWRERDDQRRRDADPEWVPDYGEQSYDYGDCRICGQVEAVPEGLGRMPLCDRMMLAVLEPAANGWRVIRRQGPFGDDQCHRGIRKFAWRDLDADGTEEIVLETLSSPIGVWEIGYDPLSWDSALHVVWPDHAFDLPLSTYSIGNCTERSVARYEFREGGRVLHVERGVFSSYSSCASGTETWPEGEEAETLRDIEITDLRWDAVRRVWAR
jgi:hypothetical protein